MIQNNHSNVQNTAFNTTQYKETRLPEQTTNWNPVFEFISQERNIVAGSLNTVHAHLLRFTAVQDYYRQGLVQQTITSMETELERLNKIYMKLEQFFTARASANREACEKVMGDINALVAEIRNGRFRFTTLETEITTLKATIDTKDAEIAALKSAQNAQDAVIVSEMEDLINIGAQLSGHQEQMEALVDPSLRSNMAPNGSNDTEMSNGGWMEANDSGIFMNETLREEPEL